jgi:hypothetical protein
MLACPKCPLINELRQITNLRRKLPRNSTLSSLQPNDGAELSLVYYLESWSICRIMNLVVKLLTFCYLLHPRSYQLVPATNQGHQSLGN